MTALINQPLAAVLVPKVWSLLPTVVPRHLSPEQREALWENERRVLKAALLYADTVEVAWWGPLRLTAAIYVKDAEEKGGGAARRLIDDLTAAHRAGLLPPFITMEGLPLDEWDSAQQIPADRLIELWRSHSGQTSVPVMAAATFYDGDLSTGDAKRWQAALASSLLGALESFPDAELDVIIDVRERLAESRTHFRAAMATVAQELAANDKPLAEKEDVVVDLRARVVDPALRELEEELASPGARRTLLRVSNDRVTQAGVALAIAAGSTAGLGAAIAASIGAMSSAAAQEAERRAVLTAGVHSRPYWFLHESAALLGRR